MVEVISGRLPEAAQPFLGRSREMALLDEHLPETRVAVVSGVAGIGKTSFLLRWLRRARRIRRPIPVRLHDRVSAATLCRALLDHLGGRAASRTTRP